MFPLRQEVSSVSCRTPLSCGHFLKFFFFPQIVWYEELYMTGDGSTVPKTLFLKLLLFKNNMCIRCNGVCIHTELFSTGH